MLKKNPIKLVVSFIRQLLFRQKAEFALSFLDSVDAKFVQGSLDDEPGYYESRYPFSY